MDVPLEVDSRGKGTDGDPTYYVITDRFGRIICDTLNCDFIFEPKIERKQLEDLAAALNKSMEP